MTDTTITVGINFDSEEEAKAIAAEVEASGASTEISPESGLLPLGVLLWIVIPPGLALLAVVANKIAQSWRRDGVLIDARGDGPPQLVKQSGLPYGTVVILTRDGDESTRTDLPEEGLGDYLSKALGAVAGGESASLADAKATA